MTKHAVHCLTTAQLWAIVNSTSPTGQFWLELTYAKDELSRRYAKRGQPLIGL